MYKRDWGWLLIGIGATVLATMLMVLAEVMQYNTNISIFNTTSNLIISAVVLIYGIYLVSKKK
jgi:hypothetical protein